MIFRLLSLTVDDSKMPTMLPSEDARREEYLQRLKVDLLLSYCLTIGLGQRAGVSWSSHFLLIGPFATATAVECCASDVILIECLKFC